MSAEEDAKWEAEEQAFFAANPDHPHAPPKLCPGCGKVVYRGDAFCQNCGARLTQPMNTGELRWRDDIAATALRGARGRIVRATPVPSGEQLQERWVEQDCPLCEGGKVVIPEGRGHRVVKPLADDTMLRTSHPDEQACPHCNGTGKIKTHVPALTEADQSFEVEILEDRPGYPKGTVVWATRKELE